MFHLELDRVIREVKAAHARRVLIQLPDGLKPRAAEVAAAVEGAGAEPLIWLGSCFGACDIPLGLEALGIDLIVQFGHNRYHKRVGQW